MPENLDQVTSFAPKNVQITGVRIAPQHLLDLDRQAVQAAPHVGLPDRQPHPYTRRYRDHRRDSALMTAAANAAGIEPGIRTRAFPTSTSIVGSGQGATSFAAALSAGAIS